MSIFFKGPWFILDLNWVGDPDSEAGWALDLNLDDLPLEFSFGLWRRDFLGISGTVRVGGGWSMDTGIRVGMDSSLGLFDDFLGLFDFSHDGEPLTPPVDCLLDALPKSRVFLLLDSINNIFSQQNSINSNFVVFSYSFNNLNLLRSYKFTLWSNHSCMYTKSKCFFFIIICIS